LELPFQRLSGSLLLRIARILGGALYAQRRRKGCLTILWFFFVCIAVNSFQKHSVIQDVILNIAKMNLMGETIPVTPLQKASISERSGSAVTRNGSARISKAFTTASP
jgi:hypothetical protein